MVLRCLRQSPIEPSSSVSSRCRNHVSPIKSTRNLLICKHNANLRFAFGGAGGNRTRVQHAPTLESARISPCHGYALRADESPSCSPLSTTLLLKTSQRPADPVTPAAATAALGLCCCVWDVVYNQGYQDVNNRGYPWEQKKAHMLRGPDLGRVMATVVACSCRIRIGTSGCRRWNMRQSSSRNQVLRSSGSRRVWYYRTAC